MLRLFCLPGTLCLCKINHSLADASCNIASHQQIVQVNSLTWSGNHLLNCTVLNQIVLQACNCELLNSEQHCQQHRYQYTSIKLHCTYLVLTGCTSRWAQLFAGSVETYCDAAWTRECTKSCKSHCPYFTLGQVAAWKGNVFHAESFQYSHESLRGESFDTLCVVQQ